MKIGDPISTWSCGGPAANEKSSINYTYAALVQIPPGAPDNGGDSVLYLGVEKPAAGTLGDNAFGFWLFKNSGVGCSGSGSFTGAHTDGDIFIDGLFTNGGGASDVEVYRWNGTDATGSISANPILTGAVCGGAAADNACAIANAGPITGGPWNTTGTNAANTFVEAGIDITALLGAAGGCFTSFLADSQTSQSTSSQPKDYASGQFNTCPQPPLSTTATPGGATVAPGAPQHDVATLSAVGQRPVPTGTVDFFLCGPQNPTATGCATGGASVGSAPVVNGTATSPTISGATDTALGWYCWRAEYTPDAASSGKYLPTSHTNSDTECFQVVHGAPALTTQIAVTGEGQPGLGLTTLGDTATLTGVVGTPDAQHSAVQFSLYGPYSATDTVSCAGDKLVASSSGTLSATATPGVFTATASPTYTPTQAGTYVWTASWAGDPLNDPASDACNEATEKVTIVGAVINVAKSANPPGPVSAGETIGFDITVTNEGTVPALSTTVTDVLPAGAGGDLNWSLVPLYPGCSISGSIGSQVLNCDLGTVNGPGSLPVIHVQSATTPADCGVVRNKASVSTTNGTGGDSDFATVTINCADLSLVKIADAVSVSAGSPIGFTVTASNSSAAGTGTAFGVVISDPLPTGPGVDWSIFSQSGTACSISGTAPGVQTVTCAIGDLAPGASYSVHLTSQTAFASCREYKNVATLSATTAASIEKEATTTVLCPDVSLTKTADAGPVDAGATIGFTVTTHNSGLGDATGVVLSDPLPTGTGVTWTIQSATGPLTCSITSNVLTCTGTLPAGATETVHITSPTVFASCKTYDNTATETLTNGPFPADAQASIVVQCSDLVLTKTPDADFVDAGASIGFTITVNNTGAGTANNVVINDPLPAGPGINWSLADPSSPNCSITGAAPTQTLVCTAVNLAFGASVSAHVTSPTGFVSCAAYPNIASLTSDNFPDAQASATTTVQCPDLTIVKTPDADTVSAGSPIGFTITVSNGGPGAATAAALSDPLAAGPGIVWFIDPAYAGPGTCTITGAIGSQVLGCAYGSLAAGASASVHVASNTVFQSCTTYDNTATATATNSPDATASASTSVLCPSPSISKTPDAASVSAGTSIGFTITVANASAPGTGTLTGATITDPLPSGPGISWSIDVNPDGCSITGSAPQTLTCPAVDLLPGMSESVHVTSATSFVSCASYDNTATLSASNAADLTASASTTVLCPDLSLTKVADDGAVDAGSPIGFTITASNNGPGTATGVVISDVLPSGSGISWSVDVNPGGCAITGSAPQTLNCPAVTLLPGASESVHVISATSFASCATYRNTATVAAGNAPSIDATATTGVVCPALAVTKTADAVSVDAGAPIGFTITASNTGVGTATGVVISDVLPTGSGISWSIDVNPGGCAITGSAPQTLTCAAVDLLPGTNEIVHVTSATAFASCATYLNVAALTGTNSPPAESPQVSTSVQCADITLTKTADASPVDAGSAIGFTITASNSAATGTGTAHGVVINDPLPAGTGVSWAIDPAYAGPGTCVIGGDAGSQVLTCLLGDLAPAADASVHVTSATTADSCADYPNTASLVADNAPTLTADASTTVRCAGVEPQPPIVRPVPPPTAPLAFTGPGPLRAEVDWALALVVLGGLLLLAGVRRRRTQ